MAYSKTTWAVGDVIEAAPMNNIEQGIESAHQQIDALSSNENILKLLGYREIEISKQDDDGTTVTLQVLGKIKEE